MSDMHDPLKDVDPWEHVQKRKEAQKIELSGLKNLFLSFDFAVLEAKAKMYSMNDYSRDQYVLEDGQRLFSVHPRSKCEGQACAIHHPSDHPLNDKPRSWQNGLIYRLCDHGFNHPDFDSLASRLERTGSVHHRHQCCLAKCCGIPEVVDIVD